MARANGLGRRLAGGTVFTRIQVTSCCCVVALLLLPSGVSNVFLSLAFFTRNTVPWSKSLTNCCIHMSRAERFLEHSQYEYHNTSDLPHKTQKSQHIGCFDSFTPVWPRATSLPPPEALANFTRPSTVPVGAPRFSSPSRPHSRNGLQRTVRHNDQSLEEYFNVSLYLMFTFAH